MIPPSALSLPVVSSAVRSRRGPQLALACCISLLAGCTVGPDFAPPTAPETKSYTPDGAAQISAAGTSETQQRIAAGDKISGDWWELYRAPRLAAVLRAAIADNHTLAAAQATLRQARQATLQAGGGLYPQIDLNAGATRSRTNLAPQGIDGLGPTDNLFTVGPTVSYALDIFGGNKRRVEQQEAYAQYQGYQLDGAYLTLTANAVKQAFEIASNRAQIKAIEAVIHDDEENVRLINAQFAAQNVTKSDLQSARSQLAADRALLPPLRQQLSIARDALAVLVGKAPGDWSAPDFDVSEFALPADLPVTLPSELVRQRPDILAAEAQLHAASAAVGVATAQLYPNITLSASLAQEALSASNLFSASATAWSIGSSLTAPLFHGGALKAQEKGAEAAYDYAFATYRQTVLQSFGQVADVLQGLDHDAQLVEAQGQAVAEAKEALDIARSAYSYGQVEILHVLDAQRQLEQARLGLIKARIQRYQDTAQLFAAMGGGWQEWRAAADAGKRSAPKS